VSLYNRHGALRRHRLLHAGPVSRLSCHALTHTRVDPASSTSVLTATETSNALAMILDTTRGLKTEIEIVRSELVAPLSPCAVEVRRRRGDSAE
jgi:hypothetical protein